MTNPLARIERTLFWLACPVILFLVMFGHMTAIEYNALGLLAIGTLAAACSADRPSAYRWPLVWPIAAWALWTLCGVKWSVYPATSMHAWLDEVLYPFIAFWGFWLFGSGSPHAARATLASWIACLLLALMSAIYWGQLQPPTAETFPLHFYNRVGHTSTLAVFGMALFSAGMNSPRLRAFGIVGVLLCVFIGLATFNRFFWPAAALTLLVALFPLYRRHLLLGVLSVCVIGAAALGTLEYSARMRIGDGTAPPIPSALTLDGHPFYLPKEFAAIGDSVSSDTRPKLWAFYGAAGMQHPWAGIGFGKPLAGMAYRSEMPPALLKLEPQALTHAHNLFINTWLQSGFVGVALQVILLLCLIARFMRLRRVDGWLCAAGIALVVGMVAKNTTDDFMWQTTILAFWSYAGLILGIGERRAGLVAPAPGSSKQAR